MPYLKGDLLPGEPILINRFDGHATVTDVKKATAANANYLATHEGRLYSIADLRTITTAFPDVMLILRDDSQGKPGSSTDPRMTLILVGTNEFVTFFSDAMKKVGGVHIPIFNNMEDAVELARGLIAKDKR